MAISLNSVIHYTDTLDNLKAILTEGFHVKYCLENVTGQSVAFPMVSFCDIPLSEVLPHTKHYGEFAIGLTKSWAKTNNLNPVLYISEDSFLDRKFKDQIDRLNQDVPKGNEKDWFWLKQIIAVMSYVKNVHGQITKNGNTFNVNHYNEREWRYVPTEDQLKLSGIQTFPINFQIYGPTYVHNKAKINSYLKPLKLKFQAKDVTHLIVRDIDQAKLIIPFLRNQFSSIPGDDIDLLITKVITIQQITEDF